MNRSHLLVVDDDPVIRLLLDAHLRSRGFDCLLAASGEEALAILERSAIDVLITDLEMPGMGGLELLAAVRRSGALTRCVVLTGYATVANLTGCLREGAVALVAKPLTDRTLVDQAVDQALQQLRQWSAQMASIVRLRPGGTHAG